jgi:hypothetical protein
VDIRGGWSAFAGVDAVYGEITAGRIKEKVRESGAPQGALFLLTNVLFENSIAVAERR